MKDIYMRENTFERYLQVPGQQLGMELAPAGTSFPAREAVIAGTALLGVVSFGASFAKPENAEAAPKSGACTPEQVSTLKRRAMDVSGLVFNNGRVADHSKGRFSVLANIDNQTVLASATFAEMTVFGGDHKVAAVSVPNQNEFNNVGVSTLNFPGPYLYRYYEEKPDGSLTITASYKAGSVRGEKVSRFVFNTNKNCGKENFSKASGVLKSSYDNVTTALRSQYCKQKHVVNTDDPLCKFKTVTR